tara:strand:- start:166 stop:1503 length:1338 start_codon:yes stop_codon:yes gene_type:complete
MFLCVACTNLIEWRGGGIPKLVWGKSGPNIGKLKQQRKQDSVQENSGESLTLEEETTKPSWTHFRGLNGEAIYTEQPILTDWPKEGPPVLWRKLIGGGHSSFSIANGLAFTIEQQENNEVIAAFSTSTGSTQWTHEYAAKFEEYFGGIGPRTTPTWDQGRLFTLGAKGHLHCLDAGSGKLLWEKNLMTENDAEVPYWGVSASPFIYKDTVIITPGGKEDNAIVALNKKTGEKVWGALNGVQTYSTPVLFNLLGKEQLIVSLKEEMAAINPNDGKLLWSHPWKIFMNNYNIAQPTRLADDIVLISAGYGKGAEAFRIISSEGSMRTESLWKSKSLKSKFSSPIFWKGYLYGLNENRLVCLDAKDGSLKWRGDKYGYGQVIAASGQLIIMGDAGDLALVEMNPAKFVGKANFKALKGGRTWNYPALDNGFLFVRNSYEMVCFDLRVK